MRTLPLFIAPILISAMAAPSLASGATSSDSPARTSLENVQVRTLRVAVPPSLSSQDSGLRQQLRFLTSPSSSIRITVDRASHRVVRRERLSADGTQVVAFQHPIFLQGQEFWSPWIPGKLLPAETELQTDTADLDESRESLLAGAAPLPEETQAAPSADFSWEPGTYHWSYNPQRFHPWAGYLWDFKLGQLWKGYRNGNRLTPSQALTETEATAISDYYSQMNATPGWSVDVYNGKNSHALSPLDKWGIWAQRAHGQDWWSASAWEAGHHNGTLAWGGYCNASAATVFLFPRPTRPFVDQNVEFDPRDIVGILQAATYTVDFQMWGHRYNHEVGDRIADPDPSLVVETLFQYLGRQGIPLVADIFANQYVDNHIILSADLTITRGNHVGVRNGTLALTYLGYWHDSSASVSETAKVPDGANPALIRKITYAFSTNLLDSSDPTHTWAQLDQHPDFLWLPTGLSDADASEDRNPLLQPDWIRELSAKSAP